MVKTYNCLLIGAGQLGSRYLEGLGESKHSLTITVVDSSKDSLERAKLRAGKAQLSNRHKIEYLESIPSSPHQYELVFVATPAHCRAKVVQCINNVHQVKAWILEKLLAQCSEDVRFIRDTLGSTEQAWVNTPRRVMAWHQEVANQIILEPGCPLNVRVSGGGWGLACNCIHFIDLACWWKKTSVKDVDASEICAWIPSKRPGFWEAVGALKVSFRDGSNLVLECDESNKPPIIQVFGANQSWIIDERKGEAHSSSGAIIRGKVELQSEITARLAEQIIQSKQCDLPSLGESARQHQHLLDALLKHWNTQRHCEYTLVPIT